MHSNSNFLWTDRRAGRQTDGHWDQLY